MEAIEVTSVQEAVSKLDKVMDKLYEQLPVITGFLLRVVLAIIVYYIGTKVIKWLIRVVKRSLERAKVDQGVIQFLSSFLKFGLYALLVFSIATSFGVDASSVAALLASAGVTVGLALQGGLSNVAGGVMLLLFQPFQVGDYIIQNGAGGSEGTVSKIEICYTTLKTMDNKSIVIPNGSLSNSTIINVTASDRRKLELKIGISYDSDIKKAKEILEKLLSEDEDTNTDEEMVVFVDNLAESSVVLGLRVWVATSQYWPVKWRLNERIKEEFDIHGIKIPYNQLDVHITQ